MNSPAPGNGFTLIELIVVISLLGMLLFLAVPRIENTVLQEDLRKSSLWISANVRELKTRAVETRKVHELHVDIDIDRFWITDAATTEEQAQEARKQGFRLPDGIEVMDVTYPDGRKISFGRADLYFFPKGYSSGAIIHLAKGDLRRSLKIEPFLPAVKQYDTYIEFED